LRNAQAPVLKLLCPPVTQDVKVENAARLGACRLSRATEQTDRDEIWLGSVDIVCQIWPRLVTWVGTGDIFCSQWQQNKMVPINVVTIQGLKLRSELVLGLIVVAVGPVAAKAMLGSLRY